MMEDELEGAIAGYRAELTEDAGLAEAEVAELEDHLRALIDELRAAGRSADDAFTEAAARLGAPRALGREYARVHRVFGARLSPARAWSAALLLAPLVVLEGLDLLSGDYAFTWIVAAQVMLAGVLVGALALRLTWARAVLIGAVAANAASVAYYLANGPVVAGAHATLGVELAALVFLAPWSRGELTAAGWGLVAIGASYTGVTWATVLASTGDAPVAGTVATLGLLAGACGALLRARWGAVALAVTAAITAMLAVRFGAGLTSWIVFELGVATVAVAAAARLAWRHAAPGLGSLRGILA